MRAYRSSNPMQVQDPTMAFTRGRSREHGRGGRGRGRGMGGRHDHPTGRLHLVILGELAAGSLYQDDIATRMQERYPPLNGLAPITLQHSVENLLIQGLATAQVEEDGRRKLTATALGRQWVTSHPQKLARYQLFLQSATELFAGTDGVSGIKSAMDGLKAALGLKRQQPTTDAQLRHIIAVIEDAARQVSKA